MAASTVGVQLSLEDALKQLPHLVGGPDEAVAAEIATLAGDRTLVDAILRAKKERFLQLLDEEGNIVPREGFSEVALWVRAQGLKMAIGTVTESSLAWRFIQKAGLVEFFDVDMIVVREDVARPKPAPDVYYETARRLGIPPQAQLVFEDSLVGLIAAREAGCHLAAIPTLRTAEFTQALYQAGAEAIFLDWDLTKIAAFVLELMDRQLETSM